DPMLRPATLEIRVMSRMCPPSARRTALTRERGSVLDGDAVGVDVIAQFVEHAPGTEAEFFKAVAVRAALEGGGALLVAFHRGQRGFDIQAEEGVDSRHRAAPVALHILVVDVDHPIARDVVA